MTRSQRAPSKQLALTGELEEPLHGGGVTRVVRRGGVVLRERGLHSDRVAALLQHLRTHGFDAAPRFLGVDEQGRDVLEYLPGQVGHYPFTDAVRSETALLSAAHLLRGLHDATAGAVEPWRGGWLLPDREPAQVVCHGDFAPYNVVFDGERAIGIIDFDTAHVGPRAWDLAYAIYRFAPLTTSDPAPVGEQAQRARRFCDAYGSGVDRGEVVRLVPERLRALVDYMQTRADAGDAAFSAHIARGDDQLYLRDIAHIHQHSALLTTVLARRTSQG